MAFGVEKGKLFVLDRILAAILFYFKIFALVPLIFCKITSKMLTRHFCFSDVSLSWFLGSFFPFSFGALGGCSFLNSVVRLQRSCNVITAAKSLIKADCSFWFG